MCDHSIYGYPETIYGRKRIYSKSEKNLRGPKMASDVMRTFSGLHVMYTMLSENKFVRQENILGLPKLNFARPETFFTLPNLLSKHRKRYPENQIYFPSPRKVY